MDHAERILRAHWPQFGDVRWLPIPDRNRFSGAELWRVSTAAGDYCLRQWPAEVEPQHLRDIHRLLRHAASEAIDYLPQPIAGPGGATLFRERGHWWELTTWLPGAATFGQEPSDHKLKAAARALARFHQAVVNFPAACSGGNRSPGLQHRVARLERLLTGGAAELQAQIDHGWPEFTPLASRILERFEQLAPWVLHDLQPMCKRSWMLQPCIRDIWQQHVLFSGSQVSGIVDFGAMAWDHVATDVARLFGSLVEDNQVSWLVAVESYALDRPLSSSERELVQVFDRANVVLSGIQWIEWICVEHRTFRDPVGVLERCHHFLRRLDWLQQKLR